MTDKRTHFGFETVSLKEKVERVAAVFTGVAPRYDIMNDAMSFGLHRIWKKIAVDLVKAMPGEHILDLACGTGDLSRALSKRVGSSGKIIASDINEAMLAQAREKCLNTGIFNNIEFLCADAQSLPLPDQSVDAVTMSFGLRNVAEPLEALKEMKRVLKPGGRVYVMEFSKPQGEWLNRAYDAYSFHVIPFLGEWIAKDKDSYRYLVESIRMHPDQETLKGLFEEAGLVQVEYFNLSGGIVAIHRGFHGG